MNDDVSLLQNYARHGSEAAFAEVVERYADLVYGAALRRTGGRQDYAADVSQLVFIQLAKRAGDFSQPTVLAAWLHTATRNAALNLMISEQRRKNREGAVAEENFVRHDPAPIWERLKPLLDEAIDELKEGDRAVVILRFLERRSFGEMGDALHISEDAARMRLDRALEKLRQVLNRRGIVSTSTALAGIVSAQPIVAAPPGLSASLAARALALSSSEIAAVTFSLFMKIKIVSAAVVGALAAFFLGTYVSSPRSVAVSPRGAEKTATIDSSAALVLQRENQRLERQLTGLREELAQARSRTTPAPLAVTAANVALSVGMSKGEIQQSILNNLRQLAAARDQYGIQNGASPGTLEDVVGRKKFIRQLRTVNGESYTNLDLSSKEPFTVKTPDGMEVTFDPTGATTTKPEFPPEMQQYQDAAKRIAPIYQQAITHYREAHGGGLPPDDQAVLPFFTTPEAGADFVEFMEMKKKGGF